MAWPNVPSMLKATLRIDCYEEAAHDNFKKRITNTLTIENTTHAWTDAEIGDLGEVLAGWATDEYGAVLDETVAIDSWALEPYRGAGSPVFYADVSADGTIDSNSNPLNVAWSVRKLTGFGGRKNRGRWFYGPVPVSSLNTPSQDYINPAQAADVLAALNILLTDVTGAAGFDGVVVVAGATPDPAVNHGVTSFSYFDLRLDTLRRRIRGAVL